MTELDPRCGKHVAGLHWLRGCHVRRNARDWRMGLGQSCGRRRSLDRLSASSALSTNRNPTQSRVMWNYNFESWITFHLSGATSHWYTSASSVVWALFVLAIYALPLLLFLPPLIPSRLLILWIFISLILQWFFSSSHLTSSDGHVLTITSHSLRVLFRGMCVGLSNTSDCPHPAYRAHIVSKFVRNDQSHEPSTDKLIPRYLLQNYQEDNVICLTRKVGCTV